MWTDLDAFTYQTSFLERMHELSRAGHLRISIPGDEPPYIVTVGPNETNVRALVSILTKPRGFASVASFSLLTSASPD